MVIDNVSLQEYGSDTLLYEAFDTTIAPWRSSVLPAEEHEELVAGTLIWEQDSLRLRITQGDFEMGGTALWLGAAARNWPVQSGKQYRLSLDVLGDLQNPIEFGNIAEASVSVYDAEQFAQLGPTGTEPITRVSFGDYGQQQSSLFRARNGEIVVLVHLISGKTQQAEAGVFYIDNLKLELVENSITYLCESSTPNTFIGGGYRYGFNGMEKDDEVKGSGNSLDFGARIYDSRLGRFLSTDPYQKILSFYSPYLFAGNKPIVAIDKDGEIEIIIHVIRYAKDGKTILKKYTSSYAIETVEDLKGINRTPLNVTLIEQMKTVSYILPTGGTYEYDVAEMKSIKVGEGGESYEDRTFKGASGKFGKWYLKVIRKFLPTAKLNDALYQEGGSRDPISNEIRSPATKYLQSAEAIFDAITLGKGTLSKKALNKLGESQLKKIIDFGAEEFMKSASKNLGLDADKTMILGYYFTKYAYEGATGSITGLYKTLETLIKIGAKGADAINQLERMSGIDLNIPLNKNGAVQKAVNQELKTNSSSGSGN